MKSILFFVVLLGCVGLSVQWGADGHRIIAQIASTLLSDTASAKVSAMLPPDVNMTDIAPLPDDFAHTPLGNWSIPCHYCNLPNNSLNFTMADCGDFCVVKSIMNYTKILIAEDGTNIMCNPDPSVEPCALEFLIHYVGDVHQPLHVGYGFDEGGNTEEVDFFDDKYSTHLHHVWDTNMIEKWDGGNGGNTSWDSVLPELLAMMQADPAMVKHYASLTNPIEWADESFYYVRTDVYNYNPTPEIEESDIRIKYNNLPWIGPHYYAHNLPIIQQRLMAAGIRLATLINAALA